VLLVESPDQKLIKKKYFFCKNFITIINALRYELDMATKPHLNMIVTGHIDNGNLQLWVIS